jgi:rhodanese-related sulfurtransferase
MIAQVAPVDIEAWADRVRAAKPGEPSPRVLLLDVREPWELTTAAVTPAQGFDVLGIPMNSLPQRLHELDRSRPVACLCHHGARSQRVAMYLQQQGFEQVANVAGGIEAWSRTRDPAVPRY